MTKLTLILASSSPYRRELLHKLGLPFTVVAPEIEESSLPNESASELVSRLALEKAQAIAVTHHNALIIGSDQVAVLDGQIITKPHHHDKAVQQLQKASGREVTFLTSLCLYNSNKHDYQLAIVPYSVHFLPLSDEQIEHYLRKEKPYNCAGSFKAESLGITLFSSLKGDDPNSLIGLPLISLTAMLRNEGIEPLQA
jgi:MAF protein